MRHAIPLSLLLSAALTACGEGAPSPVAPPDVPTAPAVVEAAGSETPTGPRFIPYDTAPRLRNSADVRVRLNELYPPLLREAGVGGTVNTWLFISESGTVERAQVNQSSGSDELDAAALELATEMVFTPAENRGEPVSVWVSIPITFRNGG